MKGSKASTIVIIYATVSFLYIALSDALLMPQGMDSDTMLIISVVKGYIYVIISAILLYTMIRWGERKLIASQEKIMDLNDEMERQEIRSQMARLDSIGHLAADLAHDLNNSLTIIEGNLAVLNDQTAADKEAQKRLRSIDSAMDRARMHSQALLSFSRGGEPIKETIDIRTFILDVVAPTTGWTDVKMTYDIVQDLSPTMADKAQLQQVMKNILHNAKEAMPMGGSIIVTGRNVKVARNEIADLMAGNYARIDVHDSGVGIPKKDLGRVFDLFYTTKKNAKGLGLSVAQNIVHKHGGIITVDSDLGEGATFSIMLPTIEEQHAELTPKRTIRKAGGKVLWMDDEGAIREIGKDLLQYLGYEADVACDGQEAIDMYKAALATEPYYAVIFDLTVPGGMGGAEAFQKIRGLDPDVRGVVCSGYSNDPVMANYVDHGFTAVLPKPFKLDMLKKVLEEIDG